MTVTVSPGTKADAHASAICNTDSFRENALRRTVFGGVDEEAAIAWRVVQYEGQVDKPNIHIFKAVDDSTGLMVGYAIFKDAEKLSELQEEPGDAKVRQNLLPGLDQELINGLMAKIAEMDKRLLAGNDNVLFLKSLSVIPSYRRQGIAQRLLECGFDIAQGRDVYLTSSPMARSFYTRNGFEFLDEVELVEGEMEAAMIRRTRSGGE